ncbi:hypothetical protein CDAR_614181 [Caerostris darwini]|uniref:Uncharacterized protein n=1 Tax=Caerostris darwini TaxID=1538125 RepID=A0AAV4WDB0_9ARAC|nr:hypothetical protein CDAR_614181 [Caerostris darwini]
MSSNYKFLQTGADGIHQTFELELPIFTKRTGVFWVGRLDSERDRKLPVFDWEPWVISKKNSVGKRLEVPNGSNSYHPLDEMGNTCRCEQADRALGKGEN